MAIALGVLFIVLGLFFVTPGGAAVGARVNRRHANDTFQGPGTKPKTVPGVQLVGLLFIGAGIYVAVQAAG